MKELSVEMLSEVEGGGFLAMVAGGLAFGLLGSILSLPVAAFAGDGSIVAETAMTSGSIGMWIGAGMPMP